jgi:hypothetical protein
MIRETVIENVVCSVYKSAIILHFLEYYVGECSPLFKLEPEVVVSSSYIGRRE